MELRVLKYFLVVAQEGNITNAATRLHIGQPTLSRQLKELEQELGQKLFVRQAHGIRLTEAGQNLRLSAKEMVAISDKIEQDFALMATNPLGDIYIGGIDGYLGEGAKLMRIGLERNLGATVRYTSCCSSDALTMLDRGLIDFAIVSQIVRIDHYEAIRFAKKGQWIALMRADNPLATKERLVVEDLAQEPLVMYDQALKTPYEYNSLAQWFGDSFPRLNIVATSNLTAALIALAQEGIGTLLTWESIATISTHDMAIIPLCPELAIRGALVWHKDRPLSPAATRYLSLLKELLDTGVIP